MSASPNWTPEELEKLKEAYPRLGRCKELQELFPTRPLQGIALKANRMGYKVANNIRQGRTNNEYIELCESTVFIPLEEYRGSTTPILHMCSICNHEWYARPQHILRKGSKCPICDLNLRKNSITKIDKVLEDAGFARLSEYTGALNTIRLRHNSCGYEWNTVYSYVQQGSGCPICNKGFGYTYRKDNLPEKAYLYLVKITTEIEEFYKIGVTLRPINIRLRELKSRIPNVSNLVLEHIVELSGAKALSKETEILGKYVKFTSYSTFSGYRELLHVSNDINIIKNEMNENF
jgi:predicted Zn-ribbon and HTH transcriptional regulator